MAAPDPAFPERRYAVHAFLVGGAAALVYLLGALPYRVRDEDRARLAESARKVRADLAAPDGGVSRPRVEAAKRERDALRAERDRLLGAIEARDQKLEEYFPGYEGGRGRIHVPAAFRDLYAEAIAKLREEVRPIAARDENGQPREVIPAKVWTVAPADTDIVVAQKEYWVFREVVAATKAVAGTLEAVRTAIPEEVSPETQRALVGLVAPSSESDVWSKFLWIPAEVTCQVAAGQVPALLARLLAAPERGLLTEIRGVTVEPAKEIREVIPVKIQAGQNPLDMVPVDSMEPPVRATVRFAVLDPPSLRRG
ncbi:MAG: hypothetical protein L0216_03995 [Planctomycetales bacterium]|nr:hypothetical protein [Planctomycetales bacterium]